MSSWKCLVLLFSVALVGCGPSPELTGTVVEKPSIEVIRTTLEQLAETGQMGSDIGLISGELEKMRATDAAKADELSKDLEALMSSSGPNATKAKAKEMLGKLGGGPATDTPTE